MTVKTYDPASYALAEHFLDCEPWSSNPDLHKRHCHSLAIAIQTAFEEWAETPDPESESERNDRLRRKRLKASAPYGEWCRDPDLCAGKGYCPRDPNCGD